MMQKDLWIDTRLSEEEMNFLRDAVAVEQKKDTSNISKVIKDKDNWFYKSALKKLTEKMFYDDWNNYRKYHIVEKEEPLPEFKMNRFWVNYMRQHEFNPIHKHNCLFSFVVFMKIPTHWKEQHALSFSANSNMPSASDFQFLWGQGMGPITVMPIPLCPEDEGRIFFFPAWLNHQVFPFYECEEERITISGNIIPKINANT